MTKKDKPREFWGFDLETSGSDSERHAIIEVGIGAPNGNVFCERINSFRFSGAPYGWDWDHEAEDVHGISQKELLETGRHLSFILTEALQFVFDNSEVDRAADRHIVGFNVAGFDLPFVRKSMPELASMFSYRTVDLNAILFLLSGCDLVGQDGKDLTYFRLKDRAKDYAASKLVWDDQPANWHEAGFDAAAALYAYEYLKSVVLVDAASQAEIETESILEDPDTMAAIAEAVLESDEAFEAEAAAEFAKTLEKIAVDSVRPKRTRKVRKKGTSDA